MGTSVKRIWRSESVSLTPIVPKEGWTAFFVDIDTEYDPRPGWTPDIDELPVVAFVPIIISIDGDDEVDYQALAVDEENGRLFFVSASDSFLCVLRDDEQLSTDWWERARQIFLEAMERSTHEEGAD